MEKEGMGLLLHFLRLHNLRRHPLTGLILSLRSENHAVILFQARDDFDFCGGLQTQRDAAPLDLIGIVYQQNCSFAWFRRLDHLRRRFIRFSFSVSSQSLRRSEAATKFYGRKGLKSSKRARPLG